jgi:hypothetical protein
MLPNNLFINLIDTNLQQRIANCDSMDKDATDALTTFLEQGPTTVRNDLDDWTTEKYGDKNVLFYKGKNYIPMNEDLRRDIANCFMITKRLGILGNWKPSIQSDITTGGQDYVHLSKTM